MALELSSDAQRWLSRLPEFVNIVLVAALGLVAYRRATVATELEALADQDKVHLDATLQVVLISDLQQGAVLNHLETFEWPDNVKLQIRPVQCSQKTNASLPLVADRSVCTWRSKRCRATLPGICQSWKTYWTLLYSTNHSSYCFS